MTVTGRDTVTDRDAARRVEAVRRFQADQGRFPGALNALRQSRLAEIKADDLVEEAAADIREAGIQAVDLQGAREPASIEL